MEEDKSRHKGLIIEVSKIIVSLRLGYKQVLHGM